MPDGIFVTGTDTGIRKTRCTITLMGALKNHRRQVKGMKPVASGAILNDGKLLNEDAELIMQHCSENANYELINPFVFEPAVAPHIAARQKNKIIDFDKIIACYNKLASTCECIIIEGIGGWRTPISDKTSMVDLVRVLDLPVIMVVGIRLGCINHAILTAESIRADGVNLCGWVSNQIDKDCLFIREIIDTLSKKLDYPHIADLPNLSNFDPVKIFERIDLSFYSGLNFEQNQPH